MKSEVKLLEKNVKQYSFIAYNDKGEYYTMKLLTDKSLSEKVFSQILNEIVEISQKYKNEE